LTGIVEPWEAILTLIFFFLVVITAFLADKKLFYKRIFKHRRRKNRIAPIVSKIEENGNIFHHEYESSITIGVGDRYSNDISSQNIKTIFHIESFLVEWHFGFFLN